jgi:hypothetical protein
VSKLSATYAILDELIVAVGPILAAAEAGSLSKPGPWRPPEWNQPATTAIMTPAVTGPPTTSTETDTFGNPLPAAPSYTPSQVYVFDAILRAEHSRRLVRTQHPIQTNGSSAVTSTTDHAYQIPAEVTIEIGMSDAMDSYYPDNWTGNASKSVSAYQTLVSLQQTRTLVTLTTRLDTYSNMLIESIMPIDTVKTAHGLRATVVLSEVFLADATAVSSRLITSSDDSATGSSGRPQTTDQTPSGTAQADTPSPALEQQHQVTQTSSVPGAGDWSSVNVSQLGGALA